jgi:iron-sulfur cluster repair protein YtfE (RIC family)
MLPDIAPTLVVNDAIRHWPAAITVLNQHGIDTCCGGAATLAGAAEEAGAPLDRLLADLREAAGVAPDAP